MMDFEHGSPSKAVGALPGNATRIPAVFRAVPGWSLSRAAAHIVAAACFIVLFARSAESLVGAWLQDADAGGGFLLMGTSIYLMWRRGAPRTVRAGSILGSVLLGAAVVLRIAAEAAAEHYALNLSLILAVVALVVYYGGVPLVKHWWAPILILFLAVPLPVAISSMIAWPMQLISARLAASFLELRGLDVGLDQNLISLPNQILIVTEGCSGIRSMLSLLALSLMAGSLWLRTPGARILLAVSTLPTSLLFNAIRIFLTGFLMHFVAPEWGQGRLHELAGYVTFVPGLVALGVSLHVAEWSERRLRRPTPEAR